MGAVLSRSGLRAAVALLAVGAGATALSACSARPGANANLIAGKQLFVSKCGSCHVLGRAQTKGTTGPNLDEAFQQPIRDGLGRSGIRGVVHGWILHPNSQGVMPPKVVTGQKAYNVAAYVAYAVAKSGTDPGRIGTAVKQAGGGKPAVEKAGALEIDTDPTGQLAYVTDQGQGTSGKITIKSQNKSGTPHDIVIDGKGKGQVVTNGGVSQFSATFAPGSYTFYCSVPGHRAAGMQGKLVVK
ncbi:MAG: hypothetical protein QOI62_2227 [Solirubrobacteraceae bacterium]|jgi:uncharacterized cupredoxin-like copper-binding protein|nr:hypothetical protein [Solirubrobacteraceae bacterium]MEA2358967.1 hypothetical protein [Solirubrobacteraceae bacterium]MEA2392465.1 hypothetical protein [Solirubrobacteraceae bacterium]